MAFEIIIKELLHRFDSSGSKSTILKGLSGILAIFIVGLIFLLKYNAPEWLLIFFAIVLGLGILIFFFAYMYCLFIDRDALRSEKYSIQKMALERGLIGDSLSGLHETGNTNKQIGEDGKQSSQSEEDK
ncbi:MAG TPA: hypothetical protein VN922_12395 [Bacteroidia bacterium]|nr:hypothetical protein [Bacteroidia bacterium]